ncbi:DUF3822 family protein [Chitinophaga niabensis]|uniref:DUF3822 family protein n=1 Tax=Chitinophaga niabensis TaxID=536979 RepID=A0A1N6FTB4_9BACT|nr:DUF3822 family protein [Chitinophaga niabensis]SIN98431.1 Protein of unknown function [Chitinophaga niabensis]
MPVAYTIQPTYAIDDATLLETDLTICTLLVLIGSGTFSYAVLAPNTRKFLALKSYSYQPKTLAVADLEMIEQIFDADKLLFTAFKEVLLAFDSPDSTLVPEPLFAGQLKKDYLHTAHLERMQEAVLTDSLPDLGMVNVYATDKDILGFLRKEFSSDRVVHAHSALLKSYKQDRDIMFSDGVVFIEVQQQQFALTIYAAGKLLLQQQLPYRSGLDIVYYIVNSLRQLELTELQAKIKLGGALTKDSQVYQELNRFLPRLDWVNKPEGFLYIGKMNEVPAHHFHNLYALALCV